MKHTDRLNGFLRKTITASGSLRRIFFKRKKLHPVITGWVIVCLLLMQTGIASARPSKVVDPVDPPPAGGGYQGPINTNNNCRPGSLPGQSGVSCTGAGTYEISLPTPPGSADFQPALSFVYNSQGSDGFLGMGWSIHGLSSITRCAAHVALDTNGSGQPIKGAINYDDNDRFCLDGQRLIPITAIAGGVREYRTEPNTFARIKSFGTTTSNATNFTVESKDGTIMEYGNTSDSRIEALGQAAVRVWAVNRMSDRMTNYILYDYNENVTTGEFTIAKIRYTGNTTANTQPFNMVQFSYISRNGSDDAIFYQGGTSVTSTQLLNRVQTCLSTVNCTGANLVNEYRLSYQPGVTTGRYHLQLVTECDSAGSCLPVTQMKWSDDGATDLSAVSNSGTAGDSLWGSGFGGSDGNFMTTHEAIYQDAFLSSVSGIANAPDAGTLVVSSAALGLTIASFVANPLVGIISYIVGGLVTYLISWFNSAYDIPKAKPADVNGDGKTDLVGFIENKLVGTEYPETVWQTTNQGTQFSFVKKAAWTTENLHDQASGCTEGSNDPPQSDDTKMGDFNGDGLMDILHLEDCTGSVGTHEGMIYLSNGSNGFTYAGYYAFDLGDISGFSLADFNGDGKTDIAQLGNVHSIYINTGTDFNRLTSWFNGGASGITSIERVTLGDVNGDGKSDLINLDTSGATTHVKIWITNPTGTAFLPAVDYDLGLTLDFSDPDEPNLVQPGDFNGDGKIDLATFQFQGLNFSAQYDTDGDGDIDNQDVQTRSAYMNVFFSNGRTFVPRPSYTQSLVSYDAAFAVDYVNDTDFLIRLADFNGDGKTDMMNFGADGTARVKFSDGKNFGSRINWSSGDTIGVIDEDTIGDFDGDGRADTLRFVGGTNGHLHVALNKRNNFPDLLTGVTDGYGAKDEFIYKPITDDTVYKCHTSVDGACDSSLTGFNKNQVFNFRGPLYVVAQHGTSNGNGGQYQINYTYKGAKMDRSYGFMGFSEIISNDPQTTRREATDYEQKFPLTCHKKGVTVTIEGREELTGPVVSSQGFVWTVLGAAAPHTVQLTSETHVTKEPYSANLTNDLVEYLYDANNNVANRRVTWPDTQTLVSNTHIDYRPASIPSWIFDEPQTVTVNRYQPNAVPARVTNYVFDPVTRFLNSVTELKQGGQSLTTTYTPDAFGNSRIITVSGSNITSRTTTRPYESLGRYPASETNALNQQTQVTYNPNFGTLASLTDPNNLVTAWQYDGFGRQILETRPDATTTQTLYCPISELPYARSQSATWIQTITTGQPDQTVYLDELGRPGRTSVIGFNGLRVYRDSDYDFALRLYSQTNPYYQNASSVASTFSYDTLGRVFDYHAADGEKTHYRYAANASLEANNIPNLTSRLLYHKVTEEKSFKSLFVTLTKRTDYFINRLNQVNQVVPHDTSGGTMSSMTYDYDGFDNVVNAENDTSGFTTRTYQDDMQTSLSDRDMGNWTYHYDVLGELKDLIDGQGVTTQTSTYDLLGRLTQRIDQPEGTSTWTYGTSAAVKEIGQLTNIAGPNGYNEHYQFDSFGRPNRTSTTIPGDITPMNVDTTYTLAGRVNTIQYPGAPGLTVQNTYNPQGYLSNVGDSSVPNSSYWKPDSLDAFGFVASETHGNGVKTSFTYNAQPAMTDVNVGYNLPVALKHWKFDYDGLGNVSTRHDLSLMPAQETTESFANDDLDRLVIEGGKINDHVHNILNIIDERTYQYSTIGNLTYKSDLAVNGSQNIFYGGTYSHAATSACDAACYAITYNGNGNMTTGRDFLNDLNRTITWYSYNKPNQITETGRQVNFTYNPMRDKVKQVETIGGNTTTIEYDHGLYEKVTLPGGGTEQKYYLYGRGDQPVALYTVPSSGSSVLRYLHYDNLGSLTAITNQNGSLAESLNFDPHGLRRNPDGTRAAAPISSVTRFGFTGQEHLDNFGLIDMKGRLYDPEIGRFISADPTVSVPLKTENSNRFSYVDNNPGFLTDPTGYQIASGVVALCPIFTQTATNVFIHATASIALQSASTAITVSNQLSQSAPIDTSAISTTAPSGAVPSTPDSALALQSTGDASVQTPGANTQATSYWEYSQSTGQMRFVNSNGSQVMGSGYAGVGDGLNNPDMQNIEDTGPLPRGSYTIGQPYTNKKTGKYTMNLTPAADNEMFGRAAFRIHGDNPSCNHTASEGCIILPPTVRSTIHNSGVNILRVVR